MIKDFDRSYNELIGGCLEKIQAQSVYIEQHYTCIIADFILHRTTQLRDLEKQRHEKVTEEANILTSRTDIEDPLLIKV